MNTTLVLLGQLLSMSFGASVEAETFVRIPVEPMHIAVGPLESASDVWVEHEKGVRALVAQQISDVLRDQPLVAGGEKLQTHVAGQEPEGTIRNGTEPKTSEGVVASTDLASSGAEQEAARG